MRKIWRVALSVCAAVVGLIGIIWIGLNLYVQSQGTQARIQQELSHRIGATLRIRSISVTPWGSLSLNGISIPPLSPANTSDFLSAKSFHLHLRLLSLFSGRVVINKVSLDDPTVVWPQDADGRWRLPSTPSRAAATPRPRAERTPAISPKARGAALVPEVRRLKITGANFKFLDHSGKLIAIFEGVNFHSNVRRPLELNGSAKIAKISLRDRFFINDLRSPLHYDATALELPKISARAGKGNIAASFAMQPEREGSPFSVNVEFKNVDADQIVSDAHGPAGMLQGKLDGKLEAGGKTADPNASSGSGEIVLRDGKVQQYSLLVALGQVLQIEELMQLQLDQAEAKYHLAAGLISIDELVLRSPNMRLSANGTVSFERKLQLDAQLAVNDKVRAKLFKPVRENFLPISEPGYSAVNFQVSGTLDRPKSNLVERMVGRDLKDLVSGLFGGKKSKKKKEPETSPAEAGQTTPTPAPMLDVAPAAATGSPPPTP
ncbi:MAG: type II secretion system protein GspN [Chthoniobacterales bacterium]